MVWMTMAMLQAASVGWSELPVPPEVSDVEVRAVAVAADSSVWLAVRGRGLARIDGLDVEWTSASDGLHSDEVSDVMIDTQGRLWAVGLGGYSVRDARRGWSRSRTVASLAPRVVYTVSEDPRTGAVWLSTSEGAGRYLGGRWTVVAKSDGLPHAVVHASHTDAEGVTWHACREGLARAEGGQRTVHFPETNFRSILEGPSGDLWLGSSDGVFRWDGEHWERMLRGRTVYPSAVSADGTVWAGSAASGVLRFREGAWRSMELPPALRGAEVFDVAEGRDGSIWLATSKGAFRMERTDEEVR